MIHEIEPKKYNPDFSVNLPKKTDYIIIQKNKELLMKKTESGYEFLTFADTILKEDEYDREDVVRTVAIDDIAYYVTDNQEIFEEGKFEYVKEEIVRHYEPSYMAFGVITACQINRWMKANKYCGKCASPMKRAKNERAMRCDNCGNMVFPKICPAVTVSVIHKNKILLVRNKSGVFHRYAQVAGYVEIGESFENTVVREVFEETKMAVKNVKYYKNQPWGMTDAQMIGYTAELDMEEMVRLYGEDVLREEYPEIRIQEEELLEGRWFSADEIPPDIATRSLTYEMIGNFRKEYIKNKGETKAYERFRDKFDIGR